jgi:predicted RNA-binding Zn ribbon-like protein
MTVPATHDFQFIGGSVALDFINTVGNRLGESRDYLSDAQALKRWIRLARLKVDPDVVTTHWLNPVRATREDLYRLLVPHRSSLSAAHLAAFNQKLSAAAALRQLSRSRGSITWSWSALPSRSIVPLTGPILFAAAELLISGDSQLIRQCQGDPCGWLFLDRSRIKRRRWCSMTDCGNREKARRHYARQHEH